MKASTLLRVSSVLTLLYFLGHSMGYPWTPSQGGATETVVGLMRSFHFDVFGSERAYWDFYLGFGLTVSVLMLLGAVVLWLLAGIAVKDPRSVRPFAAAFLLANLAQLGLVLRFFFLPPLVLSVLSTACLALALWASFRGGYEPTRT